MLFTDGDYVESNDKRSIVALKENAARIELRNTKSIQVIDYKLDKGIIPEKDKADKDFFKCDHIVECLNDDDKIVYAVELKGEDVPHALEQLTSTVKLLFEPDYRKNCKPFLKVCNNSEIEALKGKMIRLRAVSPKPGSNMRKDNGKKRSATRNVKYAKEWELRQACIRYKINFDIDSIVVKTGHSENI